MRGSRRHRCYGRAGRRGAGDSAGGGGAVAWPRPMNRGVAPRGDAIMKCDNCNKTATVHLTEIKNGKKIEKHLCEQCAAQNEGLPVKSHTPINELLTNFVMAHSGLQKEVGHACDNCGITWAEFRQGDRKSGRVGKECRSRW